jgi:drug/metabolite transporter (DMT)-like permease
MRGAAPVDAVTLLSLRMVFALPAFLWVGFVASRSALPLTGRDWGTLVTLGLLGYYGASLLDFLGLQYISAGLERLILFTYPTLTVLIGVLFMGRTLSRREVGSLLLSYAGIGLAFAHDLQVAGRDTHSVLIGAAFVFGSSLCYAMLSAPAAARPSSDWARRASRRWRCWLRHWRRRSTSSSPPNPSRHCCSRCRSTATV